MLLFVVDLVVVEFRMLGPVNPFQPPMRRLAIPAPEVPEAHLPLMNCKIVNEINTFIEGSFHCYLAMQP